ncbi:hypothetical protein KIPB_011857, partial [Kipferlia bialata]
LEVEGRADIERALGDVAERIATLERDIQQLTEKEAGRCSLLEQHVEELRAASTLAESSLTGMMQTWACRVGQVEEAMAAQCTAESRGRPEARQALLEREAMLQRMVDQSDRDVEAILAARVRLCNDRLESG